MGLDLLGTTQLFWLPLDLPADELARMRRWLSPDECARGARFHFARDRDRYVAGRGGMRGILARLLDSDPAALHFGYGSRGKPVLQPDMGARHLRFNLSHSQGMGLLAVQANDDVGVDVETVRPVPDALAIAERLFSVEECRHLQHLPHGDLDLAFARCWTRKEALLKAIGRGLSHPTHGFTTPSGELAAPARVELAAPDEAPACWLLPIPALPLGYTAALATTGGPRLVQVSAPPP